MGVANNGSKLLKVELNTIHTCNVMVRKFVLDTISTKNSCGISLSWKCSTAKEKNYMLEIRINAFYAKSSCCT